MKIRKNAFTFLALMLICGLMTVCGLTANAAASNAANEPETAASSVADEANTTDNATGESNSAVSSVANEPPMPRPSIDHDNTSDPETASGLNTVYTHFGDGYLYWLTATLDDDPVLHYDAGLDQFFLAFTLSNSYKLATLLETYRPAFKLERSLETLTDLNNLEVTIWSKPDWREKTIGEQLSAETAAKVKSGSELDAYAALQLIKQSPEYKSNAKLAEQVNYSFDYLMTIAQEVAKGMAQAAEHDYTQKYYPNSVMQPSVNVMPEYDKMLPGELCKVAQKFLDDHPSWETLSEVYALAMSGTTSKYLATFEAYDQEKLDDLYKRVETIAMVCWPDTTLKLTRTVVAVPFPVGTVWEWGDKAKTVSGLIDSNSFPTSATGG